MKKNKELSSKYTDFINEYLSSGDVKLVDVKEYENYINSKAYFLAHHPVIRNDIRTSKLRVVFDGSLKTGKGIFLNDMLLNGPVVQNEHFDILILFRTYKYIIVNDIKQMYRQVLVNDEYKLLQNIVNRN